MSIKPKPKKAPMNKTIKIRVSEQQWAGIQHRAGPLKLSDYIRRKALEEEIPDYSDRPVRRVIHTTVIYPEESLLHQQLVCIRQILEALMSHVVMVTFDSPETEVLLAKIEAVHETIKSYLEGREER